MSKRFSPNDSLSAGDGQNDRLTNGSDSLVLQGDGNLVLYHHEQVQWASNTNGSGATRLAMQDDGNLVIYAGDRPVWSSKTEGHPSAYVDLQDDGNLVLYDASGSALWATNTMHAVEIPADDTATVQQTAAAQVDTPPADAQPQAAPPPPEPQPVITPPAPQQTYTVQPGDSLSAIAANNGYESWEPIFDANRGVIGDDPNMIQPGMDLTLP